MSRPVCQAPFCPQTNSLRFAALPSLCLTALRQKSQTPVRLLMGRNPTGLQNQFKGFRPHKNKLIPIPANRAPKPPALLREDGVWGRNP